MTKVLSFSKSISRLDEILSKLEGDDLDLDQAVDLIAEGAAIHKLCLEKLKSTKIKIDTLFSDNESPEGVEHA